MTFWLILCGFLAGIVGGMGMGGGTLLVPLLSFFDISQKTIQAVNLISFLPMSIFALFVHSKNNLVKTKRLGFLTIPAVIFAVATAFLTTFFDNHVLKVLFGVFLLCTGVAQLKKVFAKN